MITPPNLQQADPRLLAQFLEVEDVPRGIWSADELGAILRHQLASSVQLDLESQDPALRARVPALLPGHKPGALTFGQLFQQAAPSLDLLLLVKQFAKASRLRGQSVLPAEIATVIYLSSIVVARLRCRRRISEQSDESLTYGIQWILDQPWVDENTHRLFREAMLHYRA
jgi:hypothetical protein